MKFILPALYDYVFPNIILPNALYKEQGIIEFIRSRYSKQIEENTICEQWFGVSEHTLANKLFSGELGNYPNSLSGSHLGSRLYSSMFTVMENSVLQGRANHNRYIYPILMTPHIDVFCGVSNSGSKLDGEYFWKHMSSVALTDARHGRATILLDYAEENFIGKSTFDALHKSLEHSNIPKENIVLALNSFNAQEIYEETYTEEERKLTVINWPFVMANTSFEYDMNPERCLSEQDFLKTRDTVRKKHFIFKVRRPRDHRMALLGRLASDDLLSKGDWSCLTPVNNISLAEGILNDYGIKADLNKVEEVLKITPHRLESEQNANYDVVSAWTDREPTPYRNSYFYICTETYTHAGFTSLTEKVFKPIANFQPFVFMAYPGALKLLRSHGFKTFHPYIDESYDDETDRNKRLDMIYTEITKICDMSIEELHDWFWNLEDILVHNHRHFLKIWKNEPHTNKFIEFLRGRCE